MTITLNHFSAAAVFALFASIVFGITHRETTRDMVRYGAYCFACSWAEYCGGLGDVVVAKVAGARKTRMNSLRQIKNT